MLVAFLLAQLLLSTSEKVSCQTSIVVVRTPKVVDISADSLQYNQVGDVRKPINVCKITLLGQRSAFASARMAVHYGFHFDAGELAEQVWKKEGSLKTREKAFSQTAISKLAVILQALKEQAPDDYAQFKLGVLETIFVSVEGNIPKLIRTNYYPHEDNQGRISVTTKKILCPGDCPRPDMVYIVYLGEYAAIREAEKRGFTFRSPSDAAQGVVQLEIEKAPKIVGPPISTLEITNKQRRWLAHGECGMSQ
jgi:hypothetical protein